MRLALLIFAMASAWAAGSEPAAPAGGAPHPIAWDATLKEFIGSGAEKQALFTFAATNTSSAPAAILNTISSCDCTVMEMPAKPWRLDPGEGGVLKVRMNLAGRFGTVTKLIGLETSHGPQVLTVRAKIPLTPAPFNVSARNMDLIEAKKDRQAVFKGSCAACHALPAAGKTGEILFKTACAICHEAEHRAEMVPDLAALTHPADDAYWRAMVTHGKPGTLMPAFAKSQGGILDEAQIDSLVAYLLKRHPSPSASNPAP